ncbi:heterokaryon incompatibility protein-domain-containing protein [Xylaria bambusicola]|uniref:heterokaryon incompatibility protein-domain-containing protein n=1 Tax=Xylaria bambusicola TaxID=326684 RepID=UPI002007A6CA|nr:heterokaryon incompatibility protein-domain-containing protein [Xylaria bambusicola]KAI0505813.1 heterokaryon incompatibility protein-domain-containing protein [Xylaria bambusicola]
MFVYRLYQLLISQVGLKGSATDKDWDYPREIQDNIRHLIIENSFGKKFLPESSLPKIVHQIDFGRLLPAASEDLIDFIKTRAPKVFLTALLSIDITGPRLVEVAKSFQANNLTDKHLPIKDITESSRCLHPDSYLRCRCSKCDYAREKGSTECPHHTALDSFHMKEWSKLNFDSFRRNQWLFCAPVFKKHNLQQFKKGLPKETALPFIFRDPNPRNGHFSTVFHTIVHPAHQDGHDLNAADGLHVAVKELRHALGEETDYDVETAWKLEVTALKEIGELKDNHLINPIAAFKWGQTHYIMFEWANGGTLRHFWDQTSDVHLHLDRPKVGEFLEQLYGLAGALQKLHGTNSQTSTGLADADRKNASSSNSGHRLSNSRSNASEAVASRAIQLGKGSGSGVLPGTAHMPMIMLQDSNRDSDVKHWRHGDIKPENILVFKDSTWIGTLKIADLGLAKQHQFATEFRHQVTSTKHTTFHYEAPEAITNMKEPRSRRYDVWSMGCIILESIIWLLYGSRGLNEFYREVSRLTDHSRQTLYFTARSQPTDYGSELVATVSDIATHWIREMLENDPECQQYTAFRELLVLVRDRLLVVPIPSKSKPIEAVYRATSAELYREVGIIWTAAKRDEDYLYTGVNRRNVKVPPPLHARSETVPQHITVQPQSRLAVEVPLTNGSSQRALNLDTTWQFFTDAVIASRIIASKEFSTCSAFPENASSICERCLTLNFESPGLIAREEVSLLKPRASSCALCTLLLRVFYGSRTTVTEIWRVECGLSKYKGGPPDLSIYRKPVIDGSSDTREHNIPMGLPSLTNTSSPVFFEILRQWLKDCDDNHPGCHIGWDESTTFRLPTRLIDVGGKDSPNICLVETQHSQRNQVQQFRYIALSHPWGDKAKHRHYFTTRQNINNHKVGIDMDVLPNTLKHAIQVTRELGVRYLWIDSLCIVQGEDGDFNEEAVHMETVFSTAYCVIAATRAEGSSSGFLGPRPARKFVKIERPGQNSIYVCESIDNFQRDVIDGPLNQRGWVLQERALARRTIYFGEKQNYWECGEGVRCETLTKMTNNQAALLGDPKFPKVATDSTKGGRIRLYELLYKQYSRLQFTRIYDRPLAISGLEQRLIRAFDTQGGYGVFTRYFGRGLLWQRDPTLAPQLMKPIQFPKSQRYQVPSWSWMAYEGAISFMDLPFREIDWEEKEIRSPWSPQSPVLTSSSPPNHSSNTAWYTTNRNERIDLKVIARDFLASADTHIIYDRGERPDNRAVRCVVVGRRKKKAGIRDVHIHYVLVVAQKVGPGYDAVYERIGVGAIPGTSIALEGGGFPAQVY